MCVRPISSATKRITIRDLRLLRPRPADTLLGAMTCSLCNVALPLPLRTTFTYAVPESMRGTVKPGSRVLVPFRKKSLVGVVMEFVEDPPQGANTTSHPSATSFEP